MHSFLALELGTRNFQTTAFCVEKQEQQYRMPQLTAVHTLEKQFPRHLVMVLRVKFVSGRTQYVREWFLVASFLLFTARTGDESPSEDAQEGVWRVARYACRYLVLCTAVVLVHRSLCRSGDVAARYFTTPNTYALNPHRSGSDSCYNLSFRTVVMYLLHLT